MIKKFETLPIYSNSLKLFKLIKAYDKYENYKVFLLPVAKHTELKIFDNKKNSGWVNLIFKLVSGQLN